MLKQDLVTSKSVVLMLLGVVALVGGCRTKSTSLQNLKPDEVTWATYSSAKLQYTLGYPTVLKIQESGNGDVLFRHGWGVPVLVRFTDETEGRKRGAWFGHEPIEKITLGGREGNKFIYEHWDGPFGARTVSYVVEHQGEFLGLEFRADGDLSEIQHRMLASFSFLTK